VERAERHIIATPKFPTRFGAVQKMVFEKFDFASETLIKFNISGLLFHVALAHCPPQIETAIMRNNISREAQRDRRVLHRTRIGRCSRIEIAKSAM
jgi:hypothetical protein